MRFALSLTAALLVLSACSNADSQPFNLPSHAITLDGNSAAPSAAPSDSMRIPPSPTPSSSSSSFKDPEAEVDIDDQAGDGTRLMIDEVEFSLDHVWLVVRSKSGELFHSELLKYGTKKASIQLDKPLITGEYIVSLHVDNGDGVFNFENDKMIIGHENEIAREDFEYSRTQ
jgi:hypothetical protein